MRSNKEKVSLLLALIITEFLTVNCHRPFDTYYVIERNIAIQRLRENPEVTLRKLMNLRIESLLEVISLTDEAFVHAISEDDEVADLAFMAFTFVSSIARGATPIADNFTDVGYVNNVLIPAVDAAGKPGAGVLRGHTTFNGLFSECMDIEYDGLKRYTMNYFRLFFDSGLRPATDPSSCLSFIALDVCFPSSCTGPQLAEVLRSTSQNDTSSICDVVAVNENVASTDAGTYIVGITMAALVIFSIISGFFHFFLHDKLENHSLRKSHLYQIFHAFSFYGNIKQVFTVENTGGKEGQIGPVHCIRFFSICWVICGHILNAYLFLSTNPLDVFEEVKHTATGFLTNAFFAVDSFFFLSGLLLAFVFFKSVKRNKRQASTPTYWLMFYVHRIVRLSPPYYFAILFYTFVFSTWLRNEPLLLFPPTGLFEDPCRKNWWINLLYLQNFVDYKHQCYLISWYLATDLQIYLFTPLILIPFLISPVAGVAASILALAISTGVNIFSVIHYYFPPSDLMFGTKDPRAKDQTLDTYTLLMYDAPWIRCQIYIIGMLCGWFLQQKQKLRINPLVNIAGWIFFVALMLTVCLGLHDWNNGHEMSLGWRAAYSAFSKPAWGLGLSWIIISCYYGYGGVINSFMSWEVFVPLGRLSYCAYLVHWFIVSYSLGMSQAPKTYTSFTEAAISSLIPLIVITFAVAAVWSAVFEMPFGKVEMILLSGGARSAGTTSKTYPGNGSGKQIQNEKSKKDIPKGGAEADNVISNGQIYPFGGNNHNKPHLPFDQKNPKVFLFLDAVPKPRFGSAETEAIELDRTTSKNLIRSPDQIGNPNRKPWS